MEFLDAAGVAARHPALAGAVRRGVLVRGAYYADPLAFTTAVAGRFTGAGGRWLPSVVRGFEGRGRRVDAVRTESGRIEAATFVIAAGAWSRSLVRTLGFETPLDTERGYGVRIPDSGTEIDRPLIYMDHHVAVTPVPGGLLLAGTDELAGLGAPPDYAPRRSAGGGGPRVVPRAGRSPRREVDELSTLPSGFASGDRTISAPGQRLSRLRPRPRRLEPGGHHRRVDRSTRGRAGDHRRSRALPAHTFPDGEEEESSHLPAR